MNEGLTNRNRTVTAAFGLLPFLAFSMVAPGAAIGTDRSTERIVFGAIQAGQPGSPPPLQGPPFDIQVMDLAGNVLNLTPDNPAEDWYPSISGDGTRIAYVRRNPSDPESTAPRSSWSGIWVMGADGSTKVSITEDQDTTQAYPNFSQDSTLIAYTQQPRSPAPPQSPTDTEGSPEAWAVAADGTKLRLAQEIPKASDPVLSPDRRHLAVRSGGDIWVSRLDGSNAINLTGPLFPSVPTIESRPDFSPDGRSIAFQVGAFPTADPSQLDVYSVNLDGSGLKELTAGAATGSEPSYSPDGRRIAFVAPRADGRASDIWMMNVDGTNPVSLTDTPSVFEDWPDWGHLEVPPAAHGALGDCEDPSATLVGTNTEDALPGTRGGDVVSAEAGNDILVGGLGKDVLCGSDGNRPDSDSLEGGGAKDLLDGGPGKDVLTGGPGDDILVGGQGNDRCIGGAGHDRLRGCE